MRTKLISITVLLCLQFVFSQVIYKEFDSYKLGAKRGIKIQLPHGYNPEDKTEYPVVIVFDGDYLFEPFAGNIDYQSYWDEIPKCIVVGINQATTRLADFSFSEENYFPSQDGATFFEFVSMELLPYIMSEYKTSPFRIIAGHDLAANFISYFLFKQEPLFDAYIAISPDFALETPNRIAQRLSTIEREKQLFYYLATADDDVSTLRTSILATDNLLKNISNEKVLYKFDEFEDSNHYTLVGQAIPSALNEIFRIFKPINRKEFSERLLPYTGTTYEYLENKYQDIKYYYGFEKTVIENDLRAVAAACEKRNDDDSLLKLAKLARKEYPESMISAYYYGLYYETIGKYKQALQKYQSGLLLTPSPFLNNDVLLEKIYKIKDEQF